MSDFDVDVVVLLENQDLFNLIVIKQDLEEELNLPVDVISYRDIMIGKLKGLDLKWLSYSVIEKESRLMGPPFCSQVGGKTRL